MKHGCDMDMNVAVSTVFGDAQSEPRRDDESGGLNLAKTRISAGPGSGRVV